MIFSVSRMAFWQNYKGWENESSFFPLSHRVKIRSMATMAMFADVVLGSQRGAPAQDWCWGYRGRTGPWWCLHLEFCPFLKGTALKMLVTLSLPPGKLHCIFGTTSWTPSRWGCPPALRVTAQRTGSCLMELSGLLSPTASINRIWAVPSYKKTIFFSLILVLAGTLTWGTF